MPNLLLPEISSEQEYTKIYEDDSFCLPAMRVICARHGLDFRDLKRETLGSHIVFRAGERIIKLFCRLHIDSFTAERLTLAHVRGLPAPELVAAGELEGWPYLVMTIVPGTPAREIWGSLEKKDKIRVITELGRMMKKLHEHPPIAELATNWNEFLRKRIEKAHEHHAMDKPWSDWISGRITGFCEPAFEPVLMSADITADHLLLSERDGTWKITGFIDFGDAKMGHPYYEFIAPLAFFTFGQPELSHTLVESYGLKLGADVAERLTTYCLLHEFGRMKTYLDRYPVSDGPSFHRALWADL